MSKAQRQRELKRQAIERQIIETSIPLIEREGHQNLTIREICENAGITTGMFYRHFKSKDDLASFCFIWAIEKMVDNIDEALAGQALPEQLVTLFCEVVRCNRILKRDGIFVFLNNSNPKCDCSVSRDILYDVVDRYVGQAVANGYPVRHDSHEIADDLIVIGKGMLFEWFSRGDDYDVLQEAHKLFEKAIGGILS